jgi:hypothetical protein
MGRMNLSKHTLSLGGFPDAVKEVSCPKSEHRVQWEKKELPCA